MATVSVSPDSAAGERGRDYRTLSLIAIPAWIVHTIP
jgi:hypothetical protein